MDTSLLLMKIDDIPHLGNIGMLNVNLQLSNMYFSRNISKLIENSWKMEEKLIRIGNIEYKTSWNN